jgi:hypothetical protein
VICVQIYQPLRTLRLIYRAGVPLPSRCCILYIFSTTLSTEYFKHAAHSPFVSSKCRLFHNATFFWFLYYLHFTYWMCSNLNVKFKDCKSVHRRTIKKNQNLDAAVFQFIILTFVYSSTCFGRFPPIIRNSMNAVAASGFTFVSW